MYSVDNFNPNIGYQLDGEDDELEARDVCSYGRVYVEAKEFEYDNFVGVYVEKPIPMYNNTVGERPSFRHSYRNLYLYHTVYHAWVITNEYDVTYALLSSDAQRPEAEGVWQVKNGSGWRQESSMKVTCVDDAFRVCITGKFRLSGIDNEAGALAMLFNGDYIALSDLSVDKRHVYRHQYHVAYIHYSTLHGAWLIHETPNDNIVKSNTIMATDTARRIEYVRHRWKTWDTITNSWESTDVKLDCIREDYDDVRCSHGRVYLGNTKFAELEKYTGIFKQKHGSVGDRPFFKHESRNVFMYYNPSKYWVVEEAGADIVMRLDSDTAGPIAQHERSWQVKVEGVDYQWSNAQFLLSMCVDDSFETCHSGKIRVSGIRQTAANVSRYNGPYQLLPNERAGNRQVYQHQANGAYLYYHHHSHVWQLYSDLITETDLFTRRDSVVTKFSCATRPEYITQYWYTYLDGERVENVDVKIDCIKVPGQLKQDTCQSGRLYVGPAELRYRNGTGIYIQQPGVRDGRPFYKHESRDVFFYHFTSRNGIGLWVVEEPGGVQNMQIPGNEMTPWEEQGHWAVRIGRRTWSQYPNLKAICVGDSFATCRTGRLRISGLEDPSDEYNGDYVLTGQMFHDRQVYTHEKKEAYLHFSIVRNFTHFWAIQGVIGDTLHWRGVYAIDRATRPEYIVGLWVNSTGNVNIKCIEGVGISKKDDINCDLGRLYFGTFKKAEYLYLSGIYEQQPGSIFDRRSFKHESRNIYIHYSAAHYWVVTDAYANVKVRMRSSADKPDAMGVWEVKNTTDNTWSTALSLRAVCVNDNFATCRTGKLHVSGHSTGQFNGEYSLGDKLLNARQVYKRKKVEAYLFFKKLTGQWVFQGSPKRAAKPSVHVSDLAARPDYITGSWTLTNARGDRRQPNLRITCIQVLNISINEICNEMFVGSINDTYADYIPLTGVFLRDIVSNKNDVNLRYKKTQSAFYLYYSAIRESWVVGEEGQTPLLKANRSFDLPHKTGYSWSVRVDRRWIHMDRLIAVCVGRKFMRCGTGSLLVSGVSKKNDEPDLMNGTYLLTNQVVNKRQVYWRRSSRGGSEFRFLHYRTDGGYGRWVVNHDTQTRVYYRTMYTEDYASRPEYIIHPWHAIPQYEYNIESVVPKVQCIQSPHPSILEFNSREPDYTLHPRCAVPFTYKERTYTKCTKAESEHYWCSGTAKFIGSWQYCSPTMVPNPSCTLPFQYKGVKSDRCVAGHRGLYWCPHDAQDVNLGWSYCNAPTIKPDPSCHFPFVYNGLEFNACTPLATEYGMPWCATKQNFSKNDWEFYPPPPCSRLYVGSIDDNFAYHHQLTGIYLEQTTLTGNMTHLGLPAFRHESRQCYISHHQRNVWKITEQAQPEGIRAVSQATRPELVTELWKVRLHNLDLFSPLVDLKVMCVSETFITCTTGRLLLSGSANLTQLGTYSLTSRTLENRQVYTQDNGTVQLYFMRNNWVLDESIAAAFVTLFVDDYATRPEYIIKKWLIYDGVSGFDQLNISVRCVT